MAELSEAPRIGRLYSTPDTPGWRRFRRFSASFITIQRSTLAEPALRILFLTQTYPRFAGDTCGPFIRDLARGLVRLGHEVTVLVPHAPGLPARWQEAGVVARSFRYAPPPMEVLGYGRTLAADERVRRPALALAPLYALAAGNAVRRELRRQRHEVVHAHWLIPNGPPARLPARHAAFGIGLHGSDVFLAERRGVRRAARWTLAGCAFLTGCSPELVDRACALGFPREQARVIPYGVDALTFGPDAGRRLGWRRKLGIPDDAPVALGVGRMATKKGFQVLVAGLEGLLAAHPTLHVVLAGGGDLLATFRVQTAPWRERVHLPGPVPHDGLPDLFRAADVFVLPAVHDGAGNVDGLPNVVLEAMASGLPVVASAVSGIPLAVRDEQEGLLVPEGDPAALVAALERLIADPGMARALGAAGRRRAVEELSWDAVAARYAEAYREGIARVAAGRPEGAARAEGSSSP